MLSSCLPPLHGLGASSALQRVEPQQRATIVKEWFVELQWLELRLLAQMLFLCPVLRGHCDRDETMLVPFFFLGTLFLHVGSVNIFWRCAGGGFFLPVNWPSAVMGHQC